MTAIEEEEDDYGPSSARWRSPRPAPTWAVAWLEEPLDMHAYKGLFTALKLAHKKRR